MCFIVYITNPHRTKPRVCTITISSWYSAFPLLLWRTHASLGLRVLLWIFKALKIQRSCSYPQGRCQPFCRTSDRNCNVPAYGFHQLQNTLKWQKICFITKWWSTLSRGYGIFMSLEILARNCQLSLRVLMLLLQLMAFRHSCISDEHYQFS